MLSGKMTRMAQSIGPRFWVALFVLVVAVAVGGSAQTYNAVTGFSLKVNTNTSRWSYRYNTTGTRDGNYGLLPYSGCNGTQWYHDGKNVDLCGWTNRGCNCILVNKHAWPLTANLGFGPMTLPRLSIFEHPSTSSAVGDTVLSFLVPKTGTVTVTYRFTDIDPYGGNGINWYVDLNSGVNGDLRHGTVYSAPGHIDSTGTRHFRLRVKRGDRINSIIDSNGDFNFDSTAVRVIVSY